MSASRASSGRPTRSYGSGARILSVGIASTGLLTLAYFSISSHVLSEAAASRIALLWSVMFVIISVIYRPIEQLLSRTIAERRARGHAEHALRVPIAHPGELRAGVPDRRAGPARRARRPRVRPSAGLYDVLVVGTLAYAASYFARGWLAGHEYFALYGGLVLMESLSRLCFALAVAVGIAERPDRRRPGHRRGAADLARRRARRLRTTGRGATRGARRGHPRPTRDRPSGRCRTGRSDHGGGGGCGAGGPGTEGVQEYAGRSPSGHDELSLRRGTGFAGWVSGIMLSEQTLLNAAVLTVAATSPNKVLAGIVFDVLLIARAPLQLFQAIQTSLLPHLTGLEARAGHDAFARAIRVTVLAIAAFAAAVALGLLAIGPFVMEHVFGQHYAYGRLGLALVGIGMGLHLTSGALNQAALARDRARAAAACWLLAAIVFVAWMLIPAVADELLRAEIGYAGATGTARRRCWRRFTAVTRPG